MPILSTPDSHSEPTGRLDKGVEGVSIDRRRKTCSRGFFDFGEINVLSRVYLEKRVRCEESIMGTGSECGAQEDCRRG